MAREVHEREDLLRDATALVPRLQLRLKSVASVGEIFAGFRSEGALSLYFNTEPVYHFNSGFQLRRAFVGHRLIKAQQGKLIAMQPRRESSSTVLVSHELNSDEMKKFSRKLVEHIELLRTVLHDGDYALVGQVPPEGDALARLAEWVTDFPGVEIADGPQVG